MSARYRYGIFRIPETLKGEPAHEILHRLTSYTGESNISVHSKAGRALVREINEHVQPVSSYEEACNIEPGEMGVIAVNTPTADGSYVYYPLPPYRTYGDVKADVVIDTPLVDVQGEVVQRGSLVVYGLAKQNHAKIGFVIYTTAQTAAIVDLLGWYAITSNTSSKSYPEHLVVIPPPPGARV